MAWAASIQRKTEDSGGDESLAHIGSLVDNFEAGNEDNLDDAHGVKKRSPQFSLAKKTGYALGTGIFKIGKTIGTILPIGFPVNVPQSIVLKLVGSGIKGAAKFGQILL